MNRKRDTYDRYAVGERIRERRQQLGISQEELSEHMDRAAKYCSDIERGVCGMSIETMLAFSEELDLSLDYMMYGVGPVSISEQTPSTEGQTTVSLKRIDLNQLMERCSERQQTYALQLLKLFMEATRPAEDTEQKDH